jgi:outer membrane biosynthesis protein TonB
MNNKLLLGILISIIFHAALLVSISQITSSNTYSDNIGESRIRAIIKNIKSVPIKGIGANEKTNKEKDFKEEISKSKQDKQGQNSIISKYLDSIRDVVASNKFKNTFATRLNLKGQVDLSFKITSPNLLTDLKIIKLAKAQSLNESAIEGIRNIPSIPSIPKELKTDTVEVEVSIIYE